MKLSKEGHLELAASVVIGMKTLEYFVEAFKKESPESVKRTVITNEVGSVNSIVMVGAVNVVAIEL